MANKLADPPKKKEKTMEHPSIKSLGPKYGCNVLQEKTSHEVANDKSLPNDAYLISYIVDGQNYLDLTRCKSCLLYTSPSPRDRQKSRMPSSA